MTQESFVEGQNQQVSTASSAPEAAPAQLVEHTTEKMIPQSQVNEIVRSATARVAEKYRNEPAQKAPPEQPSLNGLTKEEVQRIAAEAAKKQHEDSVREYQQNVFNQQVKSIADQFTSKMEAVKEKYADFDEVTKPSLKGDYVRVIPILNTLENGADVLYDLSKNPEKLDRIEGMIRKDPSGELALRTLKGWSDSIKLNEQAKTAKTPNEPLRQIQPSPTSTDGGSYTLKDLRKADWLRG